MRSILLPMQYKQLIRRPRYISGLHRLGRVIGSRNPHNTVKALFKALNAIETPKDVQEKFGRIVVEKYLL
ncbi:30S ribosomal protein S5 [Fagus crenata]